MSVIEKAVQNATGIANDNSHGYDQTNRWGPNYDCSSLIITAWESAGVPVKSKGGATYTGNMKKAFLNNGFKIVTDGSLQRGDVLLNELKHTAMYIGNNQIVHASSNENGKVTGGTTGDQTGKEITIRTYYDFPWDCVLRYQGSTTSTTTTTTAKKISGMPTLKQGSSGSSVKALQNMLIYYGFTLPIYGADGDYGSETVTAVKKLQQQNSLTADGICGKNTWALLINGK